VKYRCVAPDRVARGVRERVVDTGRVTIAATRVSTVSSPTLLLAVLYPVVGALAAGPAGIAWSLLGMVFTVVIPAAIVDLGVRRGRYTDHHLSRREQRAVPLGLAALSVLVGVGVLAVAGAPRAIVALQVAVLTTMVVATTVTLWWKVSFHVAVVSAAAAVLTLLGGGWWALAWLAVPVVGWARLRLTAHTLAQVVVGGLLGAGVTGLVLIIAGVA
jgi:membrane-associated phospholipid phosphatase